MASWPSGRAAGAVGLAALISDWEAPCCWEAQCCWKLHALATCAASHVGAWVLVPNLFPWLVTTSAVVAW
eukprot:4246193-Karenia_brevis.AAC.1